MQHTPNRFPHLVFNAISQQTYEHLAYIQRIPDLMLHAAQPEGEAVLFKLAHTALTQARAANFPYKGTYIVASTFTLPVAPALNFGPNQPLPTAYDLHLIHQQSEYDIMNKATTLDELQQIAHTLDKDNYATIQVYYRVADRIRTETIGNNKRARPNTFASTAPTSHPNSSTSSAPPLATSSAPAVTFLTHSLVYDVDEEDHAQEAALVTGAMLDEDDQPAPEPINAIVQPIDLPPVLHDQIPEAAPALDIPDLPDLIWDSDSSDDGFDPQPGAAPMMPPPDPPTHLYSSIINSPYLVDDLYDGTYSDSDSALTTLYTIDSSYYSDGELPDHNDDYYDDYYDIYPDYYDQLNMINEIPHFASVPASELALPFLSSAGIAAEDYEIPHPCISTDFLNYMEHSVEHEQREYQNGLLSHINPEFLQACPEAEPMMRSLGQSAFVPENWEGARIPALSLRFAPDFPATLHAKLIPVNPKLYVNAKQEFDRLRKYHFVPSNSSRSSNLVVAPKETPPFVRLCGNYIPINKYVLSSQHPIPDVKHKIEEIQNYSVFADLDMVNSFHQLPLSLETSEALSIITPWGLFRPKFLPEG